jgi:hypothetical protein
MKERKIATAFISALKARDKVRTRVSDLLAHPRPHPAREMRVLRQRRGR